MRRVVVTGMGLVTPLGLEKESTWPALVEGQSGFGPITRFDACAFPNRVAAEVLDFGLDSFVTSADRCTEHSQGEVFGCGRTADAFRITESHDEGRGAIACLKDALADARLKPETIDDINPPRASTSLNDSIETLAIKKTFGEAAYELPIPTTNSMMGHRMAAAGSVDAIVCVLAIRNGTVPPTINLDHPDPECDLDYVPHVGRCEQADTALSNSFGFGGPKITLILRRFVD